MKARISILVLTLAAGAAMAQEAAAPQAENKSNPPTANRTTPSEMKTMTYKGVLVDMSCKGSENCTVKSDSKELGMKLSDGRVLRLDMVGTERARDEMKNNKRWNRDLSANKPIQATVSGVVMGDKLIVSSIH